jgi:hypothetical protein
MLRTPHRAPRANAICERFLGSLRRECLDQLLILGERQLQRALTTYCRFYNECTSWCPAEEVAGWAEERTA